MAALGGRRAGHNGGGRSTSAVASAANHGIPAARFHSLKATEHAASRSGQSCSSLYRRPFSLSFAIRRGHVAAKSRAVETVHLSLPVGWMVARAPHLGQRTFMETTLPEGGTEISLRGERMCKRCIRSFRTSRRAAIRPATVAGTMNSERKLGLTASATGG
jgi:hypothetical protein